MNNANITPAISTAGSANKRRLPAPVRLLASFARHKPMATFGGAIIVFMLLVAVFADRLAPYGYADVHGADSLKSYSLQYLLGTDRLGRDILSRVVYGARISILVGLGATAIGSICATALGVVSGYFGGKFDTALQRVVDAWMSFPWLVILLTVMSIIGPGMINTILVLGLAQAFTGSRVVRSATLSIKESDFIEAARALGSGHLNILTQHILPNCLAPVIIIATNALGSTILAEASLSFLGFGIPPPTPSWGQMLSSDLVSMPLAPWLAIWPGVALTLTVFGFNMLGDGLRDVLDPRLRGSIESKV